MEALGGQKAEWFYSKVYIWYCGLHRPVLCYRKCLPEYLVDQHAGEDADEDADDGEAKHRPEAGVDRPVDHLAVRCCRKNEPDVSDLY